MRDVRGAAIAVVEADLFDNFVSASGRSVFAQLAGLAIRVIFTGRGEFGLFLSELLDNVLNLGGRRIGLGIYGVTTRAEPRAQAARTQTRDDFICFYSLL